MINREKAEPPRGWDLPRVTQKRVRSRRWVRDLDTMLSSWPILAHFLKSRNLDQLDIKRLDEGDCAAFQLSPTPLCREWTESLTFLKNIEPRAERGTAVPHLSGSHLGKMEYWLRLKSFSLCFYWARINKKIELKSHQLNNQLAFLEHFKCFFTNMILFDPHNNPVRQMLLLFPF